MRREAKARLDRWRAFGDCSQVRRNQAAVKISRTNTAKYHSAVTSPPANAKLENQLKVERCQHFVKSVGKINNGVEIETAIEERIHCV